MKTILKYIPVGILLLLSACNPTPENVTATEEVPPLFPDYTGICHPANIAPLNFCIDAEGVEKCRVKIYGAVPDRQGRTDTLYARGKDGIRWKMKSWKRFCETHRGKDYFMEVLVRENGEWKSFQRVKNHIAEEDCDPFVVYRLIQGSYLILNSCKIVERDLTSFDERILVSNDYLEKACLNCHNFSEGNPESMMLHIRFSNTGTLIAQKGAMKRVETMTSELGVTCTYPAWHPSKKYIAYSANSVTPLLFGDYGKFIHAFDKYSDLVLLDIANDRLVTGPSVRTRDYNETQPCWDKTGEYLYYARCAGLGDVDQDDVETLIKKLENTRYELMRVKFNEDSLTFSEPETVLSTEELGKRSVSSPRISPDGRFLLFCLHPSGTFASWQKESDLYLLDLETGRFAPCEGWNSGQSDSYHSWSRNNRWVAFASKRTDGYYTRLYLGYTDSLGNTFKPFMIPEKRPESYRSRMLLYNIPELITEAVPYSARELKKGIQTEPKIQLKYEFKGGVDSISLKKEVDALSGASASKIPVAGDSRGFQ